MTDSDPCGVVESTDKLVKHTAVALDQNGVARVDCAVVVVTFNSAQHIVPLLDSLPAAGGGLTLRTLVVDNGSADDTVALVRSAGATCIETGGNLGYAGAINVGREHAQPYSALFILNPDVALEAHAIERMHATLDHAGVGASVPMLLDAYNALYPSLRREPSVLRALGDAAFGATFTRRPTWLSEIVWDSRAYGDPHSVEWATGAAIMVSEACDAVVGPWDDGRFFLYSEETDFAARVRRAGFTIEYTPSARVRHLQGGSGSSAALAALMAVNRVRYYEKHHDGLVTVLFRLVVLLHEVVRVRDATHRSTAMTLLRRSKWVQLPGGVR